MLDLTSVYFGQKHKDFDYKDMDIIKKISRLARKHHRQCENSCNGEGWVKGDFYTCSNNTQYKPNSFVRNNAYIKDDITIFDKEIERIENKISSMVFPEEKFLIEHIYTRSLMRTAFRVEFQHDPRGNTVKLYYEGDYIEL
ncbi:conserved hypothetical protein [Azospirillaceae bacterium]